MTIEAITSLIGAAGAYIGFAGLGVILTLLVEGRREKIRLLFEARTKAYGQLIGKIQNSFLTDLLEIEPHKRSYEYNIMLSEVSLLSGKELSTALKEYSKIISDYFDELGKVEERTKNIEDEEIEKIRSNLSEKKLQIIELMRKDLYIL